MTKEIVKEGNEIVMEALEAGEVIEAKSTLDLPEETGLLVEVVLSLAGVFGSPSALDTSLCRVPFELCTPVEAFDMSFALEFFFLSSCFRCFSVILLLGFDWVRSFESEDFSGCDTLSHSLAFSSMLLKSSPSVLVGVPAFIFDTCSNHVSPEGLRFSFSLETDFGLF